MRQHRVVVSFGADREVNAVFQADPAALDAAAARAWFDREFVALEADVPSPIGKVLNADRVLAVARYAGERRFRNDAAWADAYVGLQSSWPRQSSQIRHLREGWSRSNA
jgi:hypothetical protein